MPLAVVFPGQGAAAPGAGVPWRDHPAWSVVTDAEAVLDRPLARLLLDADRAELATTAASQLAVLLTSLVVWEALRPVLPAPAAFAGHSLGQVSAIVAAGAVGFDDGMVLAACRADASQASADARPGRMVALVGVEPDVAHEVCARVDDVWVANDNAPGQVVLAGTAAGLDRAAEVAKELGVRRVLPLDVGHAFHTPLLADAAARLRPVLDQCHFVAPSAPIVANTDAAPHTDPAGWPELLARHLVEPVRWRETQTCLRDDLGVDELVEVGPGTVLTGLARRTIPEVPIRSVATPDDVAAVAASFAPPAPAPPDALPSPTRGAA